MTTTGVEREGAGELDRGLGTDVDAPHFQSRHGTKPRSAARSYSAALLTLGAAAIHFAATPDHVSEYLPYGIFFILLGAAQVALGVSLVVVPSRRLYSAALLGTLAVIGLWVLSRTIGLPIAPVPWRPETIAFPDFAATLLEAIACVLFILHLGRRPAQRRGRVRVALTNLPALFFAPLMAFGGVGGALTPMPHAYNAAPFVAGQTSHSVADLAAIAGTETIESFTLTAGVTMTRGLQAWAYNGTVPGPELRVRQGDRVRVALVNHLPAATSIHWHGMRVPDAMDGVAGITQDAVKPGGTFTYEFVASDAGTYWYHSHQDTSHQIARGLIGSIVVESKEAPAANVRDYSLLVHTQPGSDAIAVNGTDSLHLRAAPGDTVRLRITNAVVPGFDGASITPVLAGASYVVAALDGHDLNAPQRLGPERIPLGMGQRADIIFTMPNTGAVRLAGLKGTALFPWSTPATASVTIGVGPLPSVNVSSLPSFDLTRYGLPAQDAVADAPQYDVTREIVLGGAPGFRNGSFDFSDTFDGMASPYVPPIHVREGQLVRLHIVNNSPKFHPIHIHGHVFSVLAKNGRRLTGAPIHLDAVLVAPGETWDVAFKADNPGIWMLHCHVLAHASAGMSMTVNYEGIYTPYTMGTQSGNIPE
jgi:FtsP/CotA-like multicopper oxidase with cupredoxin domain